MKGAGEPRSRSIHLGSIEGARGPQTLGRDMSRRSTVSVSLPDEPQAEQRPIERTFHGARLIDEYAWLKPENWQQVMRDPSRLDPAIRTYLQAEND